MKQFIEIALVVLLTGCATAKQQAPLSSQKKDYSDPEFIRAALKKDKIELGGLNTQSPIKEKQLFAKLSGAYYEKRESLFLQQAKVFLAKFPRSQLADDVLFMRAENLYRKSNFAGAIGELNLILAKYPNSDRTPSALYLKGIIYRELNIVELARFNFKKITQKFPASREATKATIQLSQTTGQLGQATRGRSILK